jgi:hypothetical protein
MAVTVAVWLPLRLWLESMRSHLLTPVHVSFPLGPLPSIRGAWVLHAGLVDGSGHPVQPGGVSGSCLATKTREVADACLTAHGYHQVVTYQPASRFWHLQLIEFGIYGGLALVLLVFTYFWVTRRSAA